MLDIDVYRQSEALARQRVGSWRIAQIHNLDHFQSAGFPVRLGSAEELTMLLDTMQENRFDGFMQEFAGLTPEEHELFVAALVDFLGFHRAMLPRRHLVLPMSTLIGQLAVFLKARRYRPDFRTLLEIGPGCGYVSLFMHRHAGLADYSQIEACESFYILQNRLNVHLFGSRHREHAGTELVDGLERSYTVAPDIERSLTIESEAAFGEAVCNHYPWWQMGRLLDRPDRFDIVMANANLAEMNAKALVDYLTLARRVLRPDGILLAQCFGFTHNGSNEDVLRAAMGHGLLPLYAGIGEISVDLAGQRCTRQLHLLNAVFIRQEHPRLPQIAPNLRIDNPGNAAFLFSEPRADRRPYSREAIRAEVLRRLQGHDRRPAAPVAQLARA
jgi:SAM-dependent methyltransferase